MSFKKYCRMSLPWLIVIAGVMAYTLTIKYYLKNFSYIYQKFYFISTTYFVIMSYLCFYLSIKSYPQEVLLSIPKNVFRKVQMSYCEYCKSVQPIEKTVHCEICNACVVNYDHHCSLMYNCVGLHNKKQYLIMLYNSTIGLMICALSCLPQAIQYFKIFYANFKQSTSRENFYNFVPVFVEFYVVMGMVAMISFCGTMSVNLFLNKSIFEDPINKPISFVDNIKYNLRLVFGDSILFAFIPIGRPYAERAIKQNQFNVFLESQDQNSIELEQI